LKACVLLLPLFIFVSSSAQVLIFGKVLNQSNKNGIAYANIGIANTGVGTISNEDGTFSLRIPLQNSGDTLRISAIGFAKRNISIQSFTKQSISIELKEETVQLNEVTVISKKEKNKIFELGNRIFNGGVIQSDTIYAGVSMALLIENNPIQKEFSFPVYLEKARLRIFRNNLKSLKMSVRLYEVDCITGGPGIDITSQSIVLESSIRDGWLEFDLRHLKYLVVKPFFIAFEQLLTKNDRTLITDGYRALKLKYPKNIKVDTVVRDGHKTTRQIVDGHGLDMPGTFIGIATGEKVRQLYACYNRNTSFDRWKKVRGILTATVTVTNQFAFSDSPVPARR
jgi:hypothetical protein